MQAIGIGFPGVQCSAQGNGSVYEDITWESGLPLPSKQTLDDWILSNTVPTNRKITVFALRQRFTLEERVAIDLASIDNPSASAEVRQMSAVLRVMLDDMKTATFIDLDNPLVGQMIGMLEQYGLIATGRTSEIIDTVVLESELSNY